MPQFNPNIHQRRSIRLKGYDYAREGFYFITLCIVDREQLFGKIKDGEMILNAYGQIANNEWQNTGNIRDNIALHEFIVMPNHFHAIIEIIFNKGNKNDIGKFKSPSQTIGAIIRGYKIATIKKIKDFIIEREDKKKSAGSKGELQFAPTKFAPTEIIKNFNYKIWQRNYYDHIIRNEKAYHRIAQYIKNNSLKWDEDKLF